MVVLMIITEEEKESNRGSANLILSSGSINVYVKVFLECDVSLIWCQIVMD